MMASKPYGLTVLFTVLLCTGCASSPEVAEQRRVMEAEIDAILSEPLEPAELGETKRCLSDHEYRSFHAIDERRIVFEGRQGKLWLNTLRSRCPDLQHGRVLQVRSTSAMGRICELDTFMAGDWFAWPWYRRWPWYWGPYGTGTTCSFGEFQPVTPGQVDAIEALLDSN